MKPSGTSSAVIMHCCNIRKSTNSDYTCVPVVFLVGMLFATWANCLCHRTWRSRSTSTCNCWEPAQAVLGLGISDASNNTSAQHDRPLLRPSTARMTIHTALKLRMRVRAITLDMQMLEDDRAAAEKVRGLAGVFTSRVSESIHALMTQSPKATTSSKLQHAWQCKQSASLRILNQEVPPVVELFVADLGNELCQCYTLAPGGEVRSWMLPLVQE